MICRILPSAKDFTGFSGIIPIIVSQKDNSEGVACSAEACDRIEATPSAPKPTPGLNINAAAMAITTDTSVVRRMYEILTAPILPAERLLPRDAAPEIIEIPTSGTTNILISWIKSFPNGAKIAACSPITIPATIPATIATKIHQPRFLNSFFIVPTLLTLTKITKFI